jgi:hypothetical protein
MNLAADATHHHSPTPTQRHWLERGLDQPGGKLPLFDEFGQHIDRRTVEACCQHGWAEPWYPNPLKPDWMVCKLTSIGRAIAGHRKGQRPRLVHSAG